MPGRRTTPGDRLPSAERAFTLIEMIIAMAIMMVLMAGAVLALKGSKETTYRKEAISAGAAYAQAISQYQADHGNRNPADTSSPGGSKWTGPMNLLNKPYLRSQPDSVASGRVTVRGNCSNPAPPYGTKRAYVTYCGNSQHAEPEFSIRVWVIEDGAPVGPCYLGPTSIAGMKRCDSNAPFG